MERKKICVCVNDKIRESKKFDTYEELLKWAQEQIEKESKINIGDNVKIIDEGEMYTTLPTDFFSKVYWDSSIDEEKMFDIIRFYKYDLHTNYNGIKGVVLAKYGDKYIIELPIKSIWNDFEYIVIGIEGVKKVNA